MKKRLIYCLTATIISNVFINGQNLYAKDKLKKEVNELLKLPTDYLALKFFYKKINKEDTNYFRIFLIPKIIQNLAEKTTISKDNIKLSLSVLNKIMHDKNIQIFLEKQRRSKIDIILDHLNFYLNGTKNYLELLMSFQSSHDESEKAIYENFLKLWNDLELATQSEKPSTIEKYEELKNFINMKEEEIQNSKATNSSYELDENPFDDLDTKNIFHDDKSTLNNPDPRTYRNASPTRRTDSVYSNLKTNNSRTYQQENEINNYHGYNSQEKERELISALTGDTYENSVNTGNPQKYERKVVRNLMGEEDDSHPYESRKAKNLWDSRNNQFFRKNASAGY